MAGDTVVTDPMKAPARRSSGRAVAVATYRYRRLLAAASQWSTWMPAVVWLSGRLLALAVMTLMAAAKHRPVAGALSTWDSVYFLQIARSGYWNTSSSLAFFPGYPAVTAAISRALGIPVRSAAWVVTGLAGIVLAYGLVRLARLVPGGSRRAGLLLVGLVSATPLAVVYVMPYTETLFCALVVWALVAVLRERWSMAALLAIGAGLTRPTGVAIIAVVVAAAGLAGARSARRGRLVAWLSALAAPAGLVGYLCFVAVRNGSVTGWFNVENARWGTRIDGGRATVKFLRTQLVEPSGLMNIATVLVLLSVPILIYCCVASRVPWSVLLYGIVVAVETIGSAGLMNSKIRILLPSSIAFMIPAAIGLSNRQTRTQVMVLTGAGLLSAWFGAFCLLIYTHAI